MVQVAAKLVEKREGQMVAELFNIAKYRVIKCKN